MGWLAGWLAGWLVGVLDVREIYLDLTRQLGWVGLLLFWFSHDVLELDLICVLLNRRIGLNDKERQSRDVTRTFGALFQLMQTAQLGTGVHRDANCMSCCLHGSRSPSFYS